MLTFHKTIAGCEAGDASAWRSFIAGYSPAFITLGRIYLPSGPVDSKWKETLRSAAASDYAVLRGLEHQSEREFLAGLRQYFLASAANSYTTAGGAPPEFGRAEVEKALGGLPLVHREVLFLKLTGYSDATLEQMLRITPSVASSSFGRLQPSFAGVLGRSEDKGWQASAWLKLLSELWRAGDDSCPPLRLLIRIQDGQVGWQEKEPVEKRLGECLHCLERWTALKELAYWRSAAARITEDQVREFLAAVPVREQAAETKPLLKRLFG